MERRHLENPTGDCDRAESIRELCRRARNGSKSAALVVVRQTESVVLRVIGRRLVKGLRSQTDREDVAQSVWRSFFVNCHRSFDTHSALARYLVGIARNKTIDRGRKYLKASNVKWCSAEEPEIHRVADQSPSPEDVERLRELQSQIEESVPTKFRNVIQMRIDGMTVDEIAQEIGLPRSSLFKVLGVARERYKNGSRRET